MQDCNTWDIVKVPFPYTDRPVREWRPALVISAPFIRNEHGILWVLMITSAENRTWSCDVPVSDLTISGLPAPSVIRTVKIATIEQKEAKPLGVLCDKDRFQVSRYLQTILDFSMFTP